MTEMTNDGEYDCVVLEYWTEAQSWPFVMLAVEADGCPPPPSRLAIDPNWEAWVKPQDRPYIDAMLDEFREDSDVEPHELLSRVADLFVGPLRTKWRGRCSLDQARQMQEQIAAGALTAKVN